MRKGELFSNKIPRNPYKRHPEIPANENGFFTAYRSPPKCVRFGRRKSLPAENFRDSPDPVTFGTLDPNDKSFLRNAHRNLSMRLRNRGRKSMKETRHAKINKQPATFHSNRNLTLTESFNLSRKKVPRRERRSDVILPPLNDPTPTKTAENFLGDRNLGRRRTSGLTSENFQQRAPRRRNSTFSNLNQSNALVPSLNQSQSSSNNVRAGNLQDASTPSSGEKLKKAGRRRSSMPVVLVNGRKDFLRKEKKRVSVGGRKSEEGITFEATRSSQDLLTPRRLEPLDKKTSTNQDNIESRFETIMEISPNNEGVSPKQGLKDEVLTKEKLRSMEGGSEEEEDRRWGERIRRWLEEAATGGDAWQEVHDEVVTSYFENVVTSQKSPEFSRANAIVVVYGEEQTC